MAASRAQCSVQGSSKIRFAQGETDHASISHDACEPQLVRIHMFAERWVARHHDGHVPARAHLHDRAGAAVAHHGGCLAHSRLQVRVCEEVGAGTHERGGTGTELNEAGELWMLPGPSVHPLHQPAEGVVVRPDHHEHQLLAGKVRAFRRRYHRHPIT